MATGRNSFVTEGSLLAHRPPNPFVLPFRFEHGTRRVLLINPAIADTADVEQREMLTCVEPFGLLRLATWFRQHDCDVQWLDCLRDASLQGKIRRHARKTLACGNEAEEGVEKQIHHFGLDAEQLSLRLQECDPPDVIAISTTFTWHLEATRDVVAVCKKVYPQATVVLGGNFATLCPEQARTLGADVVFEGDIPDAAFLPTAIDLLPGTRDADFISMIKGCPHHCEYCVTNPLNGGRVITRSPEQAFAEMKAKQSEHGIRKFVFYDDFIQFKQSRFLDPLLDMVIADKTGIQLEFPLGFSSYLVTEQFAARLREARVGRIAIALETINEARSREMSRPQDFDDFVRSVRILGEHGYKERNVRTFYLMGLPGQTTTEILKGIGFLYSLGIAPSLTTYALTPGSGDWARYQHLVAGRPLDELAPCLWRFAHAGMRVADLDTIYHRFHEKFFSIESILASRADDPVSLELQRIVRNKEHLPEAW